MTNITIELCTEDRARLDAILEALKATKPQCDSCVKLVNDLCHAENSPENDAQSVETFEPKETPPKEEKPTAPKIEEVTTVSEVTVEDLRSKYMSLAATPKRDEAREIIKTYAAKISDVPVDKRAEVMSKLTALEG